MIRSRHLIILLLFLGVASVPLDLFGKHLVGGDVTYRWDRKSGIYDVYEITFTIYRDCTSGTDFDNEIVVGFYEGVPNGRPTLSQTESFTFPRVRPVQPPPLGSECSFQPNTCLEEAVYRKEVFLRTTSYGWHLTFIRCCRNDIVINIQRNGASQEQGQTYYAFIPPSIEQNSSPTFSAVPAPYMCVQDSVQMVNTATDPDGDSLVYRVVHPYEGGSADQDSIIPSPSHFIDTTRIIFSAGYNYKQPFGTNGMYRIDPQTGITTIFAPSSGWYVVALEVEEWRNGRKISTTRRDLEIIVLNCPLNPAPKRAPVNGTITRDFYIQAGERITTKFRFTDNNNQKIYSSGELGSGNTIPGSKPVISNEVSGGGDVEIDFDWQTQCIHARKSPYALQLKVQDDGCPPKTIYEIIRVHVQPFVSTKSLVGPINACSGEPATTYKVNNNNSGNAFYWEVVGGTIIGSKNTNEVKVVWGNGTKGIVRYVEYNAFGCPGDTVETAININPRPAKVPINGPPVVCIGKNGTYSITGDPASTFSWKVEGGVFVSINGPKAEVKWTMPDSGEVSVVEINSLGCPGDTNRLSVYVGSPKADTIYGSPSVCPNSKNVDYWVDPQPGSRYTWVVIGGTQVSGGMTNHIRVNWGERGNGTVKVVEITRHGCVGDTLQMPVVIDYTLLTPPMKGDTVVCAFTKGKAYEVVFTSGSTYNWQITGGVIVSGQGTNKIIVDWGAAGQGGLWVQETAYDSVNGQACIGIPVILSVRISPIPNTSPVFGLTELCEEQETGYYVTGLPNSVYAWTVSGDAVIQTDSSDSVSIYFPHEGTYTITVKELSKDSCSGTPISINVTVYPNPETSEIIGPDTVCTTILNNNSYKVTGFATSTYNWTVTNGVIKSGQGTPDIVVDWMQAGTGEVTVTEVTDFGCTGDTMRLPVLIDSPFVEIELVTTAPANDKEIEVYWRLDNGQNFTKSFFIYRRVSAEADWNLVDTVPHTERKYVDTRVQTDKYAYYYRVALGDLCNTTINSGSHRSIKAGVMLENDSFMRLNWNRYEGWKNGVREYRIYHSTNDDTTTHLLHTNNDTTFLMLDDLTAYRHCFRIAAVDAATDSLISLSNRTCIEFEPILWVPNAFTPGSWDEFNKTFRVVAARYRSYEIQIYNRWGGLVFTSTDPNIQWDGTYKGQDSPEGVYLYLVRVMGQKTNKFANGTLHLIR